MRTLVSDGFGYALLFILGLALVCLWLGLKCFAKSQARVHLVPEGIALSLFGRTLHTYPAEELKLVCFVDKGSYQESNVFLCISCHDLETLAMLRKQTMEKNFYTRTNIPYRQRKARWQRDFAREYLRRQTSMLPWAIPGVGIFYMTTSPERQALVKQMYPQLQWEDLTKLPEHYYRPPVVPGNMKPKELETPERFLQCHRHVEDLPLAAMALVFGPCCAFLFFGIALMEGLAGMVFSGLSIVWLFGSLFSLIPLEWKWVSALQEGIRVRRGKKELRFLPAEEIRGIYCFDYKVKGGICRYMAVTELSCEELTARQEAWMNRTGRGRETLSAFRLMENWTGMAPWRYLSRRMLLWGNWDPEVLILAHSPERETWLRQRYPHAQWAETTQIVNLNLFYPNLS